MPSLADLQRSFACALMHGPDALPAEVFASGAIAPSDALAVYRNNVFGGLAEALALTYPTVRRLVGEAFFDQAAAAYATAHPPTRARLSEYGRSLPRFLETYSPAAGLEYLPDVARLDLAVEQAALGAHLDRLFPIEAGVALSLPASLAVLELQWPADEIRDVIEAGDDDALAAISLCPAPRGFAVWRSGAGAGLKPLRPAAARFLSVLIAGGSAPDALDAAAAVADRDAALLAIQADVFAASFANVVTSETRSFPPC